MATLNFYSKFSCPQNFSEVFLTWHTHAILKDGNSFIVFDQLLAKEISCNGIVLNPFWTPAGMKKILYCRNFSMHNVKIYTGFTKKTFSRVHIKDFFDKFFKNCKSRYYYHLVKKGCWETLSNIPCINFYVTEVWSKISAIIS